MILKVFVHQKVPAYKILKDSNRYFYKRQFQICKRRVIAPEEEDYIIQIHKKMITITLDDTARCKEKIKKYLDTVFDKKQIKMYIYSGKNRTLIHDVGEIKLLKTKEGIK